MMRVDQDRLLKRFHSRACKFSWATAHGKQQFEQLYDKYLNKGLKLRLGRFTVQEKKLLNENFIKFCTDEAYKDRIGNPVDFVIVSKDEIRRKEVKKLKAELNYNECLSRGLFRRTRQIIKISRHTLDPLAVTNHQTYSASELHQLKTLVEKHGRKWNIISEEMGRSVVSLQSAHRNFFLHTGFARKPLTAKQQKKLCKVMTRMYEDVDLTCEVVRQVPWNEIANEIGYMHGKYLHSFWESSVKYINDKGKLSLCPAQRHPPVKIIRKMVRSIGKQEPTHPDAIDWPKWYKKLSEYVGGTEHVRAIYRKLLRKFCINDSVIGLPEASKRLAEALKRDKDFSFKQIWKEARLRCENMPVVKWQQYHWAVSPELSHYVQSMPYMYHDYRLNSSDEEEEVKHTSRADEEVW